MNSSTHQKGFTITEVILVLAIAGLIFLIAFIAIPNLQRAQRNTQRRDDMTTVYNAIIQYQINNNNEMPSMDSYVIYNEGGGSVRPYGPSGEKAKNFLDNYIHTKKANGIFRDPSGTRYNIGFRYCSINGHLNSSPPPAPGEACTYTAYGQKNGRMTLLQLQNGYRTGTFDEQGAMITVFTYASCNGEQIVSSSNKNDFAISYILEGNGSVCIDNK